MEKAIGARLGALLAVALCCADGGCGDGPAHDARAFEDASTGKDAGASHEDRAPDASVDAEEADSSSSECAIGSCPAEHELEKWRTLLEAKNFGELARFKAVGRSSVLIDLGNGEYSVARLPDPYGDTQEPKTWSVPKGMGTPVAISEGFYKEVSRQIFVLLCDEDGGACRVVRTDSGKSEPFAPLGPTLPSDLHATGLFVDESGSAGEVCAFGRGLVCRAEDEWETRIAIDDHLELNATAFGGYPDVLVGDQGRWFKRTRGDIEWGPWQEQQPLKQARLTQAASDGESLVVLGEGSIQKSQGTFTPTCAAPALGAIYLAASDAWLAEAITTRGAVLRARNLQKSKDPYCMSQQIEIGEIIATSADPCGVATNPRVLTKDALVGQNLCILVP